MSRKDRRGARKRSYTIPIALVLVVMVGVIGYFIFNSSSLGGANSSPLNNTPVSATILSDLNGVSITTLNTVGGGPSTVQSPQSTASSAGVLPTLLTQNGKPEVLYMGSEYCPYCGAERWAMIVALDKFGTFSGINYMQSTSGDIYPNTSTFTFVGATYTSSYIAFVSVEQEDRNYNNLQTANANETALLTKYDSAQSIPFIDYGNQYITVGAQYVPNELRVGQGATAAPLNWTQVASQLNTPSNLVAQYVDGAANKIISTICKIDGDQPSSVCNQTLANTLSYAFPVSTGAQPVASDAAFTGSSLPVTDARFAPSRVTAWT